MNQQFIQAVQFDWNRIDPDSYLNHIEAFQGIERLNFTNPITFFVGENGSGKSTLLEAIAVAHGFNPEGGTKNYAFSTYDSHSELCNAIRLIKGYRREKIGYFREELDEDAVSYSIWCFIRGFAADAIARKLPRETAVNQFAYGFGCFLKGLKA